MSKNFVKIIFVVALFVGGVFTANSVKAEVIQCCFAEGGSADHIEQSCHIKGSTSCVVSSICIETKIQKVCENFGNRSICDDEVVCIKYAMEQQVNCTANQECKNAVAKDITNCGEFKDPDNCSILSALCFWSPNSQNCFSKFDQSFCPDMSADDCLQVEGCEMKDGICLNPLLKETRKQYGESRGGILPSCAASGQCRNLSDILYTILKIVNEIFKYIGAIAFIFFIFGGFTMILSFGNSEKFKKGQQILAAAVIGLVIVFGAYLMITFVLEALGVSAEFKAIK